jgi:hypothetical protein
MRLQGRKKAAKLSKRTEKGPTRGQSKLRAWEAFTCRLESGRIAARLSIG